MQSADTQAKSLDISALYEAGEYLAAGYFEMPEAVKIVRMSRAFRRHFELLPMPSWSGEPVYPAGCAGFISCDCAFVYQFSPGLVLRQDVLHEKIKKWDGTPVAEALVLAGEELKTLYIAGSCFPPKYCLGGGGYTHSILNYGRILKEGFAGYANLIEQYSEDRDDEFYQAMADLIEGLRTLAHRAAETVRAHADSTIAARLATALDNVPEKPASSFYEAIVAANFMWYVDGCDNYGRFDQDLGSYLDADLASGAISRSEALDLVKLLWRNINANNGWNVTIGGSDRQGNSAYNTLTELCLEAAKGSRRPNLALRVRRDMPDRIFDLTIDSIASGCGLPAMYNEETYTSGVRQAYSCKNGDEFSVAFGGCTETMIHGCSNVGSIDGGISLLTVLSDSIDKHLASAQSYSEFEEHFIEDMRSVIATAVDYVNRDQQLRAASQPHPIRSLFIDDCLENGVDYNSGGARYNGGVFNLGGLANVADSLVVIKDLIFGGKVGVDRMLAALKSNFSDDVELLQLIRSCPKFGNDDDRADSIAARIAQEAFAAVKSHASWRGNTPFLPACIMFVTYDIAGKEAGATPDGRLAFEPVADSIGPVQGRDGSGPTAMLRSTSKLPLSEAIGTPVLNVRFSADMFNSPDTREKVKSLIKTYFEMGGMQLQISVVDQAVLKDAIAHPDKHQDLIVRIGGYSEYFNNLSTELKYAVLERTEHKG
ncbi:MAG: pyruvate formate lyase family protein [Armatimonadota bacterium]|nr:hypothetical protein [bacterium]